MNFGGPEHGTFYVNAVHLENGLYEAQYVPRVAGEYTVHVTLLGTDLSGSPYSLTVLPGEISSLKSNTVETVDSTVLAELEAGVTFLFDVQLVDIYSNDLISGQNGNEIEILALYEHHDAWPSHIAIPDYLNWEAVYGADIVGLSSDNNDGSYSC